MLRIIPATAVLAACALIAPSSARADEPVAPAPAAAAAPSILRGALARAWAPSSATTHAAVVQARRANAGPNIASVGLGGVAGLSDFEIGPSFRYWVTERFGLQAHLGFGGEEDFRFIDDVGLHAIRADVHRRDR